MNNINLDKYYIINPVYKFKDDIKRIILTNNNTLYVNDYYYTDNPDLSSKFSAVMHPLVAYMFAFFNGEMNLRDTITELSSAINKPFDDVLSTFSSFIHNSEQQLYTLSQNTVTPIPKNFIIEKQDLPTRDLLVNIDINKMLSDSELDLSTFRNYVPNAIMLMITNNCMTDCVYCYADRSHKVENLLTFERIKELIAEAHSLGCREFDITGGEIFLYKKWEELLDALHKYEYNTYLSTKVPIGEDIIIKLKERNIDKIQISLDTVNREVLKTMIKVPLSYLDKMKNTLDLLQKHNIKFAVKSVITKFNDDLTSVKNLIDFLLQYGNLLTLSIAPGQHSLYKHFTYKSNKENLSKIQEYVDGLNHPKISMQPLNMPFNCSFEEKKIKHNNRSACSGNVNFLFILPDGKVTICEQIYWTPFFILGDVTNQSIMEVWNSPKALSLWNIKQEEIQEASPCKKCDIFERCRRGAGTCWRMAMQAYGIENYDFPDPDCPYAPPVTKPFYH
jgi:radical SAM protein with 4Fe4S-binding SPASM domain